MLSKFNVILALLLCFPFSLQGASLSYYGVKGDGITDDTRALQRAIDANKDGHLKIGPGVYRISLQSEKERAYALRIKEGTYTFESAIFIMDAASQENYGMLLLDNAQDVKLSGNATFVADKNIHKGKGGEGGHVLSIIGGNRIEVDGLRFENGWGDGIYIGGLGNNTPTNVTIRNVVCNNNSRNGLSVVNGRNILIEGSTFSNNNRTMPKGGIDLEPNPGCVLENVTVRRCVCLGHIGYAAGFRIETDNSSCQWEDIVTDGSFYCNTQGNNIKVTVSNVVCGDGCLEPNLYLHNTGKNNVIKISKVSLCPNKERAAVNIGNPESSSKIELSDVDCNLKNWDGKSISAQNSILFTVDTDGHNMKISSFYFYGGKLFRVFCNPVKDSSKSKFSNCTFMAEQSNCTVSSDFPIWGKSKLSKSSVKEIRLKDKR